MTNLPIVLLSVVFAMVIFVLECTAEDRGYSKSAVIEPGVGIGMIRLGDDIKTVLRKMARGRPTEGKTVKYGSSVEFWLSYAEQGITFIFNQKEVLTRIAVSNPVYYVRQKGIRPKASAAEIDRLYDKPQKIILNDNYDQKIYNEQGLAFTIDKYTNKIDTITIIPKRRSP